MKQQPLGTKRSQSSTSMNQMNTWCLKKITTLSTRFLIFPGLEGGVVEGGVPGGGGGTPLPKKIILILACMRVPSTWMIHMMYTMFATPSPILSDVQGAISGGSSADVLAPNAGA